MTALEENGCTKEHNDRFIYRYQGFLIGILIALAVAWQGGVGRSQPDPVDPPSVIVYVPAQ